ncbi:MAG: transporter substrate-binding domain-containing protein [Geminicoccaceae bacterium]
MKLVLLLLLCLVCLTGGRVVAETPDEALSRLLAEARSRVPASCADPAADALVRILCTGQIRIGVRNNYPLFATGDGEERQGYDIDVARAVAARLGVKPVWVPVKAATRIAALVEGEVDLVVATMGHNTQRDAQVRFIRPHYYRSETIVVGPRDTQVRDWNDLPGHSICVTVGNYANSQIVAQGSRLVLFDDASRLPAGLQDETCSLAAQDDSFFASYLTDPAFGDRFERKFGFDPVPWGMAVRKAGADRLAEALTLISEIMHKDGEFLALARRDRIATTFLEEQQKLWGQPACAGPQAASDPACVLPALVAEPPPTSFAPQVKASLAWIQSRLGIVMTLPMLTSEPAWQLFQMGILNSFLLVIGTVVATFLIALLVGAASTAASPLLRWPAWLVVAVLQSSPVVLTLVVAASIAHAFFAYSATVALCAAIVALGLMNGCNAGQAIGEAAATLRAEGGYSEGFSADLYRAAVGRSTTQLLSFLVNAVKGTPIASFTGAPELLGALTDITSFASGRVETYTIVLIFYTAVVAAVVWACEHAGRRLRRMDVTA